MKDRGVLIGRIGRHMNILKLRPPLPFGEPEAELAVGTLDAVLRDLG
jgi:4-aminobutyrate aminotransferase-like enzyme